MAWQKRDYSADTMKKSISSVNEAVIYPEMGSKVSKNVTVRDTYDDLIVGKDNVVDYTAIKELVAGVGGTVKSPSCS